MTLTLILTLKHNMSHLSYQVEFAPKVMYRPTHGYNQISSSLIENDLQLDINAKLDLESQNRNQK